ncbi:glycoside hydrolase family 3 N-terminal domain-containing protein [Myxococcota bacterium]
MTKRFPYQDPEHSISHRIDDLMHRMSLPEKVGQMVQADGRYGAEEQVREQRVGSFLHILGQTTLELQKLAEQTGWGIPLLFGIDAIHGHGFWPGATVFPSQLALSCSWNPDLAELMGRITAEEMRYTGLHWTFSPVLCIARDLRWGRVGETFGEDPYLIGVLGAALVRGYQGHRISDPNSVLACAKHFAGYSETIGGRDASEAELSERKLRAYFLPPFRAAVKAGCRSFMTAYQCIDGVACTVNRWLLTEVLRNEWGFDGFVVTDWDNVGRSVTEQMLYSSLEAAVCDAVGAGNDMLMVTPGFYSAALSQLRQGKLDQTQVELACRRVLEQKFALGLFDHKRYPPLGRAPEVIGCAEHRSASLRCALEAIVLLKNGRPHQKPRPLPFSSTVRRIAVLGPNADDPLSQLGDWSAGSGQVSLPPGEHPRHLVRTVLDGIRARAARSGIGVEYERGAEILSSDTCRVTQAAAVASQADVAVVVVGDVVEQTGELCDRSELDLTGGQMALLEAVAATGTLLIVVLINSKPLCVSWVAEHADAVVEAFNPGMEGGDALAALLFGDHNPSGKLTLSFPRVIGEQPVHYQQIPGWHGSCRGNYSHQPLYAFGHGLSYTEYAYCDLQLSTHVLRLGESISVRVCVRNVGARAGVEIVQLYLNDIVTSLSTPSKTLQRFARIHLEPGQSEIVSFVLPSEDLRFLGRDCRPVSEPGEFEIMVGPSSRDEDLLRARFNLVVEA